MLLKAVSNYLTSVQLIISCLLPLKNPLENQEVVILTVVVWLGSCCCVFLPCRLDQC